MNFYGVHGRDVIYLKISISSGGDGMAHQCSLFSIKILNVLYIWNIVTKSLTKLQTVNSSKMKILIAISAILGTAIALPQYGGSRTTFNRPVYGAPSPSQSYSSGIGRDVVPIVAYSNDIGVDGSFQYSYQTGDGISAQANSQVKNLGGRDVENSIAQVIQGSYSYTAPDGQVITVNYVADENGYRAEGAHLPTPPPIPPEIARSLELVGSSQGQAFGGSAQSFRGGQYQAPRPVYGVAG